ncbi:MAG: urease accessory protein UreD [Verrucomicrobiota bacterium]
MAHQGIHSRGYLPHWDFAGSVQAITFRLADSLPSGVIREWQRELQEMIDSEDSQISQKAQIELHQRICRYEDAGHGSCLLAKPEHAKVVQDILIQDHGSKYQLIDWCIMPNHVHVVIHLLDDTPLGKIIKHWKAPSAVLIHQAEGLTGSLWMADYHDRLVRDLDHLQNALAYIRNNPVKAGLCAKAEEWAFSGTGSHWSAEFIPREEMELSEEVGMQKGSSKDEETSFGEDVSSQGETGSRGMNSALPVSGSALSGHLDLRCDLRSDGVPYISRQSFRAPVHLSKSHLDEGRLVQSIVNPTAGFFDGDRLEMNVEVGRGAQLVLSTPSASRVYRTRSGAAAEQGQRFQVEEDGFLEWIPEPFIPHAGARYVQRTEIHLQPSASLLYFDWITPGRVAMGEVFAYDSLRWELDLTVSGVLLARERCTLGPGAESLEALRAKFPAAHYLSVYAAGAMTRHWPAENLDALSGEDVYLGHGPLSHGVCVIRALCRDSLAARKLIEELRRELHRAAGLAPAALGRISW